MSAATDTVEVNGLRLYYESRGEGEPLVLLHGFTGAGSDWQYVFDGPPPGFRTIVPDLRGHGRSTNPSGVFTHRDAAADVVALLDRLGIQRFKAIGMSTGAKSLLHIATRHPERVEGMVLVSATPYFPDQARTLFGQFSIDNVTDEEWSVLRKRHQQGDDQIRTLYRQGRSFRDSFDDVNFSTKDLSAIGAPTLLVHGDRDPFYPVAMAIELYKSIPDAFLWIVPGGGHGPIFGDRTAAFVATAVPFLRGEWRVVGS
jgi:pimeloyl-ACP methyl ester carboxylesterase